MLLAVFRPLRTLATLLSLLTLCACGRAGDTLPVEHVGEHITVRLVSEQTGLTPGGTINLGIHFKPEEGWHVYWSNPGDSGLPPQFEWNPPEGLTVKAPLWPYPKRIQVGPLVNYGYDEVLLPFPSALASSARPSSSVTAKVALKWLVCKDECIPGKATLSLTLPVSSNPAEPSKDSALFAKAFDALPRPLDKVAIAVEERDSTVVIALLPQEGRYLPNHATFYPEDRRLLDNAADQESVLDSGMLKLTLKRAEGRKEPVERIRGVLVSDSGWSPSGFPKAVSIDTEPQDEPPERLQAIPPSPVTPQSGESIGESSSQAPQAVTNIGFAAALVFAFLGGLILNLMPCVFPVLSIKILSFVEHASDDPRKIRFHGLSFCAGVLISFWILAAILLALRAGGEQLGWGFQLQSPIFVAGMVFVFFTLALLFLSDLAIGQSLQRLAGSSRLPTSYIGSFTNGVLATAVATPCTGPFMSSAIAATITLPAVLSVIIFTAVGLGMSAPYLLLSFNPRLLKWLPRPGAWMETFKQLMAFPLFASVVWLIRVFARQMGIEPLGLTLLMNLLWGLLFMGFGFWALTWAGEMRSRFGRSLCIVTSILSVIIALVLAYPPAKAIEASRSRAVQTEDSVEVDSHGLAWESYSPSRVAELTKSGRSVFIDFTAEWCITCQVNKEVVFSSPRVRELIASKNVALIRGDWTSMNPLVTQGLAKYGRNGVPFNVIERPGKNTAPILFPNILTAGIVIEELEKL